MRTTILLMASIFVEALASGQTRSEAQSFPPQQREHVKQLAEGGDASAQYILGLGYLAGWFDGIDQSAAAGWFRKAGEQGSAQGQYALGVQYANGEGVPQDYAEAAKWFLKSAKQGTAEAQHNLGILYSQGRGVPEDLAEAAWWYRKAADQGYVHAQVNLGVMYVEGHGVRQNFVEAYMWLELAAAKSNGIEQNAWSNTRQAVAELMTPEQISEAQRRARDWVPVARKQRATKV